MLKSSTINIKFNSFDILMRTEKDIDEMAVMFRLVRQARRGKGGECSPEDFQRMVKERKQRRDRKEQREYENEQRRLNMHLSDSLIPHYECKLCSKPKWLATEFEMIEHFVVEHGLEDVKLRPENPDDIEYNVLNYLIIKYNKIRKKIRYFDVSNKELWDYLRKYVDPEISSQKPRHILNDLGLTKRGKREKKRLGYNKGGARVYHINIKDLKKAVDDSEFDDLKLEFLLYQFIIETEPLSSISEKNEKSDESTEETEEYIISDDDFAI